ncbi:MAG: S-layer homology domain-containing protein [Oscillospiraceae bacterium]|nr:S-layer homology domain-containing protein [Oscillospiraceae bacterium]
MGRMRTKRILSALLAMCMMISLLPAVPVLAGESAPLKTYTYITNSSVMKADVTGTVGGSVANLKGATIRSTDAAFTAGLIYDSLDTTLTRQWAFESWATAGGNVTPDTLKSGAVSASGRLMATMKYENITSSYLALKLNVENAGLYNLDIGVIKHTTFADSDVYFFPKGDIDTFAVTDLEGKQSLGTLDGWSSSTSARVDNNDTKPMGLVTVETAGDYYIVFKFKENDNSNNVAGSKQNFYLREIVLKEAKPKIELSCSPTEFEVGEKADLTVKVWDATGAVVTPTVTYTYDDTVVSVSDGKVEGLKKGSTTLKAEATVNDVKISASVNISVLEKDNGNSGVSLEYLFNSGILSEDTKTKATAADLQKPQSGFDGAVLRNVTEWLRSYDAIDAQYDQWMLADMSYISFNLGASYMNLSIKPGAFGGELSSSALVAKVKVPNKGAYKLALNASRNTIGTDMNVYLVSVADYPSLSRADINGLIPVGYFDTKGSGDTGYTEIGTVDVKMRGEYYLVFDFLGTNGAATNDKGNVGFYPIGAKLYEATPTLDVSIDADFVEVGGEYPINAVVYDKLGKVVKNAEFDYSVSTDGIVSVENGVVKALAAGKVTVTATVRGGVDNMPVSGSFDVEVLDLTEKFESANYVFSYRAFTDATERFSYADFIKFAKYGEYADCLDLDFTAPWSVVGFRGSYSGYVDYSNMSVGIDEAQLDAESLLFAEGKPGAVNNGYVMKINVAKTALYTPSVSYTESPYGMQAEFYLVPTDAGGVFAPEKITGITAHKDRAAGVATALKGLTPSSEYHFATVKTSPTEDMPVYKNILLREGDYFLFVKPIAGSEGKIGSSNKYYLYLEGLTLKKATTEIIFGGAKTVGIGDTAKITAKVYDVKGNVIPEAVVTFASGDARIAAVDENTGEVTGTGVGETLITATTEIDGEVFTNTVKIKVYAVEFARLESTPLTIEYSSDNKTAQIELKGYLTNGAEISLDDAEKQYTSKTPDIVSVDENGVVTALRAGRGIVEVSAAVGEIGQVCNAEITVTDNSTISSVTISGAASVGYLRDTQLSLTVKYEDGREKVISGDIDDCYPGADVEWKIVESSAVGAVTIDENGMLFGEIPGATAKIGAVLTVGNQVVSTTEPFEIAVDASSDNDPRSFGYDFHMTRATTAKFVDIDVDGWEPDFAASSSTVRLGINSNGMTAQTNGPNQVLTIKFRVPYSGLYDISLSGRANAARAAEKVNIFVDGRYVGDFAFYYNALTRELPARSLSAIYLDKGDHVIKTVTCPNQGFAENYVQVLRTLYFTAEPQTFGMEGIILEDENLCLTVGESANPNARMLTDAGFVYAWENENDDLLDVTYTIASSDAADGSNSDVVSVDASGNVTALANGTATLLVTAVTKDGSQTFEKTASILVSDIIVEPSPARTVFYTGEASAMSLTFTKANGNPVLPAPSYVWESSDTDVASFDGTTFTAKAPGTTVITAKEKDTENVLFEETVEVREDFFGVVEIEGNPYLTVRPGYSTELSATAKTMAGKLCDMTDAVVEWSMEDEYSDIISIDVDGSVTAIKEGTAYVNANVTLQDGSVAAGTVEISVRSGKVSRTFYTQEKTDNMQENVEKYAWASSEVKTAVKDAEKYLTHSMEELWSMVPGEGIPRSWYVGIKGDPDRLRCRYCDADLKVEVGSYPWAIDVFNYPWKVQCPICKRRFPSNDFESFYKLGIDPETGIFDRELALEKHLEMFGGTYGYGYLKNDAYPELRETGVDPRTKQTITHGWGKLPKEPENIADVWGVDDGYGYETGRMAADSIRENHTYIWFYNHFGLWYQSGTTPAEIYNGITKLAKAYLYTGDEKYGRLGAVMFDRLADVYPDFFASIAIAKGAEFGNTDNGKIVNNIWEAQRAKDFIIAYDALFPIFDDPEVKNFLQAKAEQYPAIGDKSTANAIRENIENNYIYEVYVAAQERNARGNFGFIQSSIGAAAVVLDRQPDSLEMLDWVFRKGLLTEDSYSGADIYETLIEKVTRDGHGTESPAYNRIWLTDLSKLANMLEDYEENGGYSLWSNPKYVELAKAWHKTELVRRGVPSIGDSNTAGGFGEFPDDHGVLLDAFKYTKDKEETKESSVLIAQRLYELKMRYADDLSGVHYDIFTENPESVQQEILDIIKAHGEYDYDKSSILTGYGFAALRGGTLYDSVGSDVIRDTTRDFWMYFGGQLSHSHNDMLNLGIHAYGLDLAPENGYPEGTSSTPSRGQWTMTTLAHNTVVVNEKSQYKPAKAGDPLHFDAKDVRVKVMDVDVPEVYEETQEYRRTVVMVDYDDEVSYGVDFFKILGGDDHLYSFHAASEVIGDYSDNINVKQQLTGSYAGADVPFGNDPWTNESDGYARLQYPAGYTWLFDVRKDANPEISGKEPFYVDFDIIDFNKHSRNSAKMDINLRMTMVNDFAPDEITFAKGYPPRTAKNLENIDYYEHVLVRRKGTNLNTLFTTVFEPYNGSRYISDIKAVNITADRELGTDKAAAVKVTLSDGRIDYIVYAQNENAVYTVYDPETAYSFTFSGFVGVWTVKPENGGYTNMYSYINDGTQIGTGEGQISGARAKITGTVEDFNGNAVMAEGLSFNNWIDISFTEPVEDVSLLVDRVLNVEHEGLGNAAYFIEGATLSDDGMSARIDLGGQSPINSYIDSMDISKGYKFDVAKGKNFEIALSHEDDRAPNFTQPENIGVTAGSSVTVNMTATSNVSDGYIEYSERQLPRGASLDTVTGKFTWKPDSSQVGENLVAINAVDSLGRVSTRYFTITVYGSTTGSPSQGSDSTDTTDTPSGGGGGGGGGGAAPAPDTDENVKPDDGETTNPDNGEDTTVGEGVPALPSKGFTDLASHAWAADAINELAEAGIIKGTSETTFSPANNITRADFALLLVRAFGLESDNTENFADVEESDYFARELAIARNCGIVGGIGDNKYAPRNTITRQDMMVIVYRALKALGIELEVDEVSYPDFDKVAPYAQDAVKALITAGLVNGKNGKIDPAAYTTRAEVAVLIKRILDFLK